MRTPSGSSNYMDNVFASSEIAASIPGRRGLVPHLALAW
jgi:hypothetical protein